MGAKQLVRRSECPTAFALDIFGDRWTLLIIRDLMFRGQQRYSEFLAGGEGIATNILADRLARLQTYGIIASSPDPANRRAKLYRLTRKGKDLAPLMVEMILWSARYDPDTPVSKAFVRRAKQDRQALLDEITADPVSLGDRMAGKQ